MSEPCILIVEDEAPIRAMIRYALEMEQFAVLEARDAIEAQRVISQKIPDLILLDWMLPEMSGVIYAKQLKQDKLTRNIPIIMLTARAEEDNKVRGFEAGVDDYVIKPFSPRELIARIRAVLRRGLLPEADGFFEVGDLIIDTRSQRVKIGDINIKVGPLEYRLLCFFIKHQDRVYTRDELLTHVWGGDAYVDERTVDVHIRRLRNRLKPGNHDRFIQTIHGSGYRFSQVSDKYAG